MMAGEKTPMGADKCVEKARQFYTDGNLRKAAHCYRSAIEARDGEPWFESIQDYYQAAHALCRTVIGESWLRIINAAFQPYDEEGIEDVEAYDEPYDEEGIEDAEAYDEEGIKDDYVGDDIDPELARVVIEIALNMAEDQMQKASLLSCLAELSMEQGKFLTALKYHKKALSMLKCLVESDSELIIEEIIGISHTFHKMALYNNAIAHMKKAREILHLLKHRLETLLRDGELHGEVPTVSKTSLNTRQGKYVELRSSCGGTVLVVDKKMIDNLCFRIRCVDSELQVEDGEELFEDEIVFVEEIDQNHNSIEAEAEIKHDSIEAHNNIKAEIDHNAIEVDGKATNDEKYSNSPNNNIKAEIDQNAIEVFPNDEKYSDSSIVSTAHTFPHNDVKDGVMYFGTFGVDVMKFKSMTLKW